MSARYVPILPILLLCTTAHSGTTATCSAFSGGEVRALLEYTRALDAVTS